MTGSANLEITGTVRNYAAQEAVAELKLKIEPENFSGDCPGLAQPKR